MRSLRDVSLGDPRGEGMRVVELGITLRGLGRSLHASLASLFLVATVALSCPLRSYSALSALSWLVLLTVLLGFSVVRSTDAGLPHDLRARELRSRNLTCFSVMRVLFALPNRERYS
ncbi:hypothetical protein BDV93DRAFT_529310 [Ceratobasidium sp. AG-I]|nr:hypothetical protein BDV93DRAFT_529310 [Ceratobasidium sp. AG-I]